MICDSCGGFFEPSKQGAWCPHTTGNIGLVAGGVVAPWAHDNVELARIAEKGLLERLRKAFSEVPLGNLRTGAEHDALRQTKFRTWVARGLVSTPDGGAVADGLASMGWQLHVELDPGSHPLAKTIMDELPAHFEGFEVHLAE